MSLCEVGKLSSSWSHVGDLPTCLLHEFILFMHKHDYSRVQSATCQRAFIAAVVMIQQGSASKAWLWVAGECNIKNSHLRSTVKKPLKFVSFIIHGSNIFLPDC